MKIISVPWSSKHGRTTYLFETLAIDLLKASKNQTQVASLLRCGFNVVNQIIHRAVARGLLRRKLAVATELSLDEKSFKKGHNYITVLSDPGTGCVLDVTEGRDKACCKSLLESAVSAADRDKVKAVSMDMWKAYMKAAREVFPQADIVHDRFHLVQYLNKAVDQVRRREVKKQEELKRTRYIWLKNPGNLTENQKEKFQQIVERNFEVSRAWKLKESFRDLFGCDDYYQAFGLFSQWTGLCLFEGIKEVNKVVKTFQDHTKGVCNALVTKLSNAMAERLNRKIQEIKTVARGYRKFSNFRNVILFFLGGLELYPLNSG